MSPIPPVPWVRRMVPSVGFCEIRELNTQGTYRNPFRATQNPAEGITSLSYVGNVGEALLVSLRNMSEQKKYKLTKNTKVWFGTTLYQIEALVSFGSVVKGELGGYIEKEKNLAQVYGDAWVYGDAQVYGDAWVYGDARVYGKLKILTGYFFGVRYKKEEIKYKQVDEYYEVIYKGEAKFDETPDTSSLIGKEVTVTLDGKTYKAVIKE